jgi:hypothetical protein
MSFVIEAIQMITRQQQQDARRRAAEMMRQAGIFLSEKESEAIEVVDFGLNQLKSALSYYHP